MSKIKIVLPIALALFLPVLNLFSNPDDFSLYSLAFLLKWFGASLVLFLLWYMLLYVSSIKNKCRIYYTILSILVFIGVVYVVLRLPAFENLNVSWMLSVRLMSASLLMLIIQYALRASQDIARLKIEKEQMLSENYRVQLQELRQRVDPHFLFNSMNTLRTMIRNQHPQSEEFVMNLSGFYRQTLKFNDTSVVSLQEEMDVLKSYLFLMKIRNEGKVLIEIDINNELRDKRIPTLSLQIVAENCFKHNQASASNPLHITIQTLDDSYVAIRNSILPKLTKSETSGFGLENIRKRYELLGIGHGVVISQTGDYFEVKLKLIEKE